MDKSIDRDLSQRVKQLIDKYQLNGLIFAGLLNIPYSTFNGLLTGKLPWRLIHISKLAKYFGVSTDWLIFGDDKHIKKFTYSENLKLKQSIKDFLVKEGHYQTYGKLEATGYFKELE